MSAPLAIASCASPVIGSPAFQVVVGSSNVSVYAPLASTARAASGVEDSPEGVGDPQAATLINTMAARERRRMAGA